MDITNKTNPFKDIVYIFFVSLASYFVPGKLMKKQKGTIDPERKSNSHDGAHNRDGDSIMLAIWKNPSQPFTVLCKFHFEKMETFIKIAVKILRCSE